MLPGSERVEFSFEHQKHNTLPISAETVLMIDWFDYSVLLQTYHFNLSWIEALI